MSLQRGVAEPLLVLSMPTAESASPGCWIVTLDDVRMEGISDVFNYAAARLGLHD